MSAVTELLKGEPEPAEVSAYEPRIIGFLCNWCSYAGADRAGQSQTPYPPNVQIIRVMCTGRIDPFFIMKTFERGADGVLVLACHPGDCHYKEGNLRAAQRHALLARVLEPMGIERERCRFDYVSAGEGEKYLQVITEMVAAVKRLGPINTAKRGGRK